MEKRKSKRRGFSPFFYFFSLYVYKHKPMKEKFSMNPKHNLVIALICFVIAILELVIFKSTFVFNHSYMLGIFIFSCGFGGYHFGLALAKTL